MIATENISEAISQTFWNGMIKETIKLKDWYERDPSAATEFIKNSQSPKETTGLVYRKAVREGLTPIEDLAREEKVKLIQEAGRDVNVCRSIYLLKQIK